MGHTNKFNPTNSLTSITINKKKKKNFLIKQHKNGLNRCSEFTKVFPNIKPKLASWRT